MKNKTAQMLPEQKKIRNNKTIKPFYKISKTIQLSAKR